MTGPEGVDAPGAKVTAPESVATPHISAVRLPERNPCRLTPTAFTQTEGTYGPLRPKSLRR